MGIANNASLAIRSGSTDSAFLITGDLISVENPLRLRGRIAAVSGGLRMVIRGSTCDATATLDWIFFGGGIFTNGAGTAESLAARVRCFISGVGFGVTVSCRPALPVASSGAFSYGQIVCATGADRTWEGICEPCPVIR
ncbi:hypothetical protein N9231_03795 [Saprospiraceae bacterium]|nr:hypothetical protein [Saprospiraceae bacterium]